ncbi:MAG TPA: ATP-binding cassette domain-containing protein [Flexivirga sp.]|uniref:ABC transporter ATP-binding protein n=1 Tax=Flexivirga sp. TaxID=1962927 RepID=UPI002D07B771|nr:ATP-binding cassette domain-containing protein [Flexivirga sp.]HWC23156.1 ATP-binding cassette domain-containing protein [Flexivirga sp.]
MPTPPAIRIRAITKHFGDVIALDDVDLDIPTGQIHGLVGPNGAGKTTLLGMLLGLTAPTSGEGRVLDQRLARTRAVPSGVAGFLDGPGLYPTLTARQNLTSSLTLAGNRPNDDAVDEMLDTVGLSAVAHERVRGFSLGMRQRLGLAAAVLAEPRLLVLDEPANGLDPAGKRQVHGVLTDLAARGTTVVLSSHRMDDVEALCDEVTILVTGRVAFTGPLAKLAAENDALDYRLVISDRTKAQRIAATTCGIHLRGSAEGRAGGSAPNRPLLLSATIPALDGLMIRLAAGDVAVRELTPVLSPLEAAFLKLTDDKLTDNEEVSQ